MNSRDYDIERPNLPKPSPGNILIESKKDSFIEEEKQSPKTKQRKLKFQDNLGISKDAWSSAKKQNQIEKEESKSQFFKKLINSGLH